MTRRDLLSNVLKSLCALPLLGVRWDDERMPGPHRGADSQGLMLGNDTIISIHSRLIAARRDMHLARYPAHSDRGKA